MLTLIIQQFIEKTPRSIGPLVIFGELYLLTPIPEFSVLTRDLCSQPFLNTVGLQEVLKLGSTNPPMWSSSKQCWYSESFTTFRNWGSSLLKFTKQHDFVLMAYWLRLHRIYNSNWVEVTSYQYCVRRWLGWGHGKKCPLPNILWENVLKIGMSLTLLYIISTQRIKSSFDIWTKDLLNKIPLFKEFSAYKQLECVKSHEYKSKVSILKETKWKLRLLLISYTVIHDLIQLKSNLSQQTRAWLLLTKWGRKLKQFLLYLGQNRVWFQFSRSFS